MNCKNKSTKKILETYEVDGVKYRKSNKRMIYDPEFHDSHGKKWTKEELAYLSQMRPGTSWTDISLALGRTYDSCSERYRKLKKQGKLDYYKKLDM